MFITEKSVFLLQPVKIFLDSPTIVGFEFEMVNVILNRAVELSCNITGTEPLTIKWQRSVRSVGTSTNIDNSALIQVYK